METLSRLGDVDQSLRNARQIEQAASILLLRSLNQWLLGYPAAAPTNVISIGKKLEHDADPFQNLAFDSWTLQSTQIGFRTDFANQREQR